MLDLKVQTFLKVCETMNYTKAARELHLTQPAVTKHIQSLEDYYHIQLFQYRNRTLMLTPEGEKLHQVLSNMNQDLQKLRSDEHKQEKRIRLHIGATLSIGNYSLIQCVPDFLSAHPDVDLSITIADTAILLSALQEGSLDFIFCEGNYPKGRYQSQLICQVPMAVFCGSSYPLERPGSVSDLLDHTLITREKGSGTRDIFESFLRLSGYGIQDFRNHHEVNHTEAILKLLAANTGISVLYENVGSDMVSQGLLKMLSLKEHQLVHEFNLVWNKSNLPENELLPYAEYIRSQLTAILTRSDF
ncbi:MAG: LysR family transcriptional regulator [Lachnospiraceae bacterium]|nr:LysR family transcriptional regulator [Lachnospiraceae bacterium]